MLHFALDRDKIVDFCGFVNGSATDARRDRACASLQAGPECPAAGNEDEIIPEGRSYRRCVDAADRGR